MHGLSVERVLAQKKFFLSVYATEQDRLVLRKLNLDVSYKDSSTAILSIKESINNLHKQSYILASLDSLIFRKDTIIARIKVGDPFKWASLKQGNVGES